MTFASLLTYLICLQTIATETTNSDHDRIMQNIIKFSEYVVSENYIGIGSMYDADARIFPRHSEIIEGRNNIIEFWRLNPGDTTSFHKIYPIEIKVVDDTAYDHGYYEISGVRGKRRLDKFKGKYVVVWKRNRDNEWRIYLDIWNYVK